MKLSRSILAIAGSAMLATAANAADVMPVVMPAPVMAPVVMADPGFDWAGFYVGVYGGPTIAFDPIAINWVVVAGQAGFNFLRGPLLIGARVQAGAYFLDGRGPSIDGDIRAGAAIGNNLLLYGTVGIGTYGYGPPGMQMNFAGGVEVGLGSRVSLQLEAGGEWYYNSGPGIYPFLRGGINFHFGN